jgi:hypothetical protein
MASLQNPASDMLVTVKSREIQRAMLAESRGDKPAAMRHFLAAAHLKLVLAGDYEQAGDEDAAFRSRVSAGSCFWRGGEPQEALAFFDALVEAHPGRGDEIRAVMAELESASGRSPS